MTKFKTWGKDVGAGGWYCGHCGMVVYVSKHQDPKEEFEAHNRSEAHRRTMADSLAPKRTQPTPDKAPSLDEPCPHPARRGRHEEYMGDDKFFCRACGATTPDKKGSAP